MGNDIQDLKAELAALEPQQVKAELSEDAGSIPDDDPELLQFIKEREECRKQYSFVRIPTLAQAKVIVADQRRRERLFATIVDGTKPMDEGIASIKQIQSSLVEGHPVKQRRAEQLVLEIKPQQAKARELYHVWGW